MVKLVGDSGKGPGEKDQFRPKLIPMGKNPPADTGDTGKSLGQEDALQETMPTRCNILTWRIPWTEEPVGLGVSNAVKGTVKEDFRMQSCVSGRTMMLCLGGRKLERGGKLETGV